MLPFERDHTNSIPAGPDSNGFRYSYDVRVIAKRVNQDPAARLLQLALDGGCERLRVVTLGPYDPGDGTAHEPGGQAVTDVTDSSGRIRLRRLLRIDGVLFAGVAPTALTADRAERIFNVDTWLP